MWETWVQSLGWEDPLEKGIAAHGQYSRGRENSMYSPQGLKELDMTEQLSLTNHRLCDFEFVSLFGGGGGI